ncbi:hypothetical protein ACFRLW_05560, partial [Streptomyces sp. NPDC056728]
MDPAVLGTHLASSVLPPLVKQLLTRDGPGAALVDKPVRLSGLVTFHGEKRTLGLTCLSRVTSLSSLSVIQPVPGDSLAAFLPVGAPLDQLILGRGATEATGLNGLGALPELTWPNLSSETAALGPRDWEQLARHPALTRLSLGGRLLPPHGPSASCQESASSPSAWRREPRSTSAASPPPSRTRTRCASTSPRTPHRLPTPSTPASSRKPRSPSTTGVAESREHGKGAAPGPKSWG